MAAQHRRDLVLWGPGLCVVTLVYTKRWCRLLMTNAHTYYYNVVEAVTAEIKQPAGSHEHQDTHSAHSTWATHVTKTYKSRCPPLCFRQLLLMV